MTDKELLKMFGLYDRSVELTLEEDIHKTMNDFVRESKEHDQKKKEFISLFKECFDDLCLFMEKDPQQRIAINCFTCIKGVNLSKQYGKPKKEN